MFLLINDIIHKNVENVTKNYMYTSWLKYSGFNKAINCNVEDICKKLTSVYFNEAAIKLLTIVNKYDQTKNILKKIKFSFKLLCRDFDKGDYSLEKSLKRAYPSIVRK